MCLLLVQYTERSQERERLKRANQLSPQPLPKISIERETMRKITVNTTVNNDVCEESREYTFNNKRTLNATIYLHPDKQSSIWASSFSDNTWSIAIGNVHIHDISDNEMIRLLEKINIETQTKEQSNVTSDD